MSKCYFKPTERIRQNILQFQQNALAILPNDPHNQKLVVHHLQQERWDMLPNGQTWSTASPEEVAKAIRFFGPAAYRVLRWSRLPEDLTRPAHILGGACLITSADREHLTGQNKELTSHLTSLPSLTQVSDGILGLAAPDATERRLLYINEDSLFAEQSAGLFGYSNSQIDQALALFQEEGARALCLAKHLAQTYCQTEFQSTNVSYADLSELIRAGYEEWITSDRFFEAIKNSFPARPVIEKLLRTTARGLVMYSYSQHFFENVLVPAGLTTPEAHWVITEPFHHFSKMPMKSTATHRQQERVGCMYQTTADYFTRHAYENSYSDNGQITLVATLPAVTDQGLAFAKQLTKDQPGPDRLEEFERALKTSISSNITLANPVLQAGINYCWHDTEARQAINELVPTVIGMKQAVQVLKKNMRQIKGRNDISQSLVNQIRSAPLRNGAIKERLAFLYEKVIDCVLDALAY